ncbi:hypothetical protein RO3G_04359 [Rhizopus delemar RA 99-880]|uniref:RING-type domain-containing protein n=1 Tax=Rhizopus delemar (strain RA 99-880 / ATCC MYA-4621 / FGSC 9543 / NRRL 43880) TaxID=246409 RepID=I1BTX4_RHIO9|nr:hypothetical protein RO3G_04359 [Rhizopus delemar RA 99-880]|eukprot:EIE79654.1 hypothetical protein RO3G_04359 [Rhizopus delemar RA 99-880]
MKFGKQMETAAYDLPENWRPHLIHYKTLKKSIRLVVDELESRGLSTEWINTLDTEEAMKLDYTLSGNIVCDTGKPQPCIKITIDDPASIPISGEPILLKLIPMTQCISTEPLSIKIELVRDSEFFRLLLHELSYAAALHNTEKERFLGIIDGLENQLTVVASPQKDDLCGRQQSSKTSQEQLEWFTQELTRMKLAKKFINKYSKVALTQFLSINAQLVQFKQFQTLNQTAMIKILKKHDKRSGLCATSEFSSFAKDNAVFIEGVLSGLFHAIQTKIITIVPQPDDYDCPVCYSIAWRPIRLECGHVFCVRCLIKAHKKRLYDCPVCRQEYAVGNADATNLDQSLQNFMLMYFPREIKEKRSENVKEQAAISNQQRRKPKQYASAHLFQTSANHSVAARDHLCTIM